VEHNRGALPGDAVLPVIVGGVHRSAAEHASDGAGGIGAIISNATPHGRGANITSVVVGDERLHTHKLKTKAKQKAQTFSDIKRFRKEMLAVSMSVNMMKNTPTPGLLLIQISLSAILS
jgi:hypothetical protein